MKKVIVLVIIIVCVGLMYQFPHAMLNPGELVEGHQKLNDKCLSCHNPFWGISNDKCISCHKLSDIGKDTLKLNDSNGANENILFHQHLSNRKCTSCHTDHKGMKPEISLSNFNHEMLPITMISNCKSCHGQPVDNLHKQLTADCNNCHNTKDWKSSVTFNHDMIQGNTKNDCASCHKKSDDSFHQQLKEKCDKCHTTSEWKPSTFDHSIYFQLDKDHNVECKRCHTNNNFSAFTCYGCHEHSESKLVEEHHEHGIYNFTDCASCHPNSDKHDIRIDNSSNQKLNQGEVENLKKYIKSQEKDKQKKKEGKKEHNDD